MALSRRASLPVWVVLDIDPAVDPESDYEKYKESLFDEAYIKFDPVEKPTKFKIRQLSDEQKDMIASSRNVREQAKMAIRCSLIDVDNYILIKADGTEVDCGTPEFEDGGRLGKIVKQKWLSELNLPAEHLAKLYILIDHFSEVQRPLAKL